MSEVEYLAHHGIKGQKWGNRRYQNPDGSLTPEGQKRYGIKQTVRESREKYRQDKARLRNEYRKNVRAEQSSGADILEVSRRKRLLDDRYRTEKSLARHEHRARVHSAKGHELRTKYHEDAASKNRGSLKQKYKQFSQTKEFYDKTSIGEHFLANMSGAPTSYYKLRSENINAGIAFVSSGAISYYNPLARY